MSEFDSDDERDRDDDPDGRSEGRTDPSSVVNLGINVGIGSLTDLLSGIRGVSSSPSRSRGEWQRVAETARDASEGSAEATMPEPAGPVDVADEFLVETHRTEDEFVVTAELPGVSEEDLSVGIDVRADELVIAVDGRSIDRISLPWSSTDAAKVWFNNGILEVRLRPAEDDAEESDEL